MYELSEENNGCCDAASVVLGRLHGWPGRISEALAAKNGWREAKLCRKPDRPYAHENDTICRGVGSDMWFPGSKSITSTETGTRVSEWMCSWVVEEASGVA